MKRLIYILAFLPLLVHAQGNFWASYMSYEIPTVVTHEATAITATTATSGGYVADDGGANVHTTGVCYNTTGSPTINDDVVITGEGGIGSFQVEITGLTDVTTYYYRAFAINEIGTGYGGVYTFTTSSSATTPSVTTIHAYASGTTTITAEGEVTNTGGATITEQGFCYMLASSSGDPTTSNDTVQASLANVDWEETITGLTENTTYKIRAYAINSEGTAYGLTKEVTTEKTTTNPPVYNAKVRRFNLFPYGSCPYNEGEVFIFTYILYTGQILGSYEGEEQDSLIIYSVDYDYDNNGYEGHVIKDPYGNELTFPLRINLTNTELEYQYQLHHYYTNTNVNDLSVCLKPNYVSSDKVSIYFSIKDVNGEEGIIDNAVIGVYYEEY